MHVLYPKLLDQRTSCHPRVGLSPFALVVDLLMTCTSIAEALDKWFEDLQEYEQNLESMASASLDSRFKDELNHVDQWFTYLDEAERTATVYSLLQHSSQVQIRFFITVLQQMAKKDPVGSLLSPAHPEKCK